MDAKLIEIKEGSEESGLIPACKINIERFFIDQYGAKKLLADIKKMAFSFGQDVSTEDGREVVRSTAYKIARSRTFIKALGQDLVKADKERVKKTNATIKFIEDETKKIQDDYRKPLTEFEEKEKKEEAERKEKEKQKIDARIKQLQEYRCVLPYGEVAGMSDEEFDEVIEREKKAEEDRKAEAERLKKEQDDLEKQKKQIREQKIQVITMRLTSFGMECEDNYFTFRTENAQDVGIALDDIVDLDIEAINHKLDEIADAIEMAKITSDQIQDAEPEIDEINRKLSAAAEEDKEEEKDLGADTIEMETTASGTFTTDSNTEELKEESVLSQTLKSLVEADINILHNWIDTMKSIAKARPVFSAPHSDSVADDISISFIEFFDKTKDLVIEELR